MRTPMFAFRQEATVKRYVGNTSLGPTYQESVEKCRIEHKHKLVIDANGDNVTSPARALFPNTVDITPQSIVVHGGREYKVTDVMPQYSFSGIAHIEVVLV